MRASLDVANRNAHRWVTHVRLAKHLTNESRMGCVDARIGWRGIRTIMEGGGLDTWKFYLFYKLSFNHNHICQLKNYLKNGRDSSFLL